MFVGKSHQKKAVWLHLCCLDRLGNSCCPPPISGASASPSCQKCQENTLKPGSYKMQGLPKPGCPSLLAKLPAPCEVVKLQDLPPEGCLPPQTSSNHSKCPSLRPLDPMHKVKHITVLCSNTNRWLCAKLSKLPLPSRK